MSKNTKVYDETEQDDTVPPIQYNITSFGADYDVEGLVNRLNRDDIIVPPFQRSYVWSISDASRFIESLLLGLPVPGIFLARDPESKKLLVIDGQQRLKSLQFFRNGVFNPDNDSPRQRVFKLNRVQPSFEGLTYDTLSDEDRRVLNDSIIHATIVHQEYPQDDDTSIYHIFERLNTTGRKLSPQEIRVAIYNGPFIDLLSHLNDYSNWREIYGKKNVRLKDQELILRFLSLYYTSDNYSKPMTEFLNVFVLRNRFASQDFIDECTKIFFTTIDAIHMSIGNRAFRPQRTLHTAVFDSVMVGIARRIFNNPSAIEPHKLESIYYQLLQDPKYEEYISGGTSDETNVANRLKLATDYFSGV